MTSLRVRNRAATATLRALGAVILLVIAGSTRAGAQFPQWSTFPLQYPDARVLRAGLLRVSFLPSYAHYDSRFATDGVADPLGADLAADTAGSNFLPSLLTVETAVRAITRNASYRASLGTARTNLDADVRRFPLDGDVGLTDWLTLSVRLPLVRTRVQGHFTLDSTTGNLGWNQLAPDAANAAARAQVTALLSDLESRANALEAGIQSSQYGCPSSPQCARARALLTRMRALRSNLLLLTGADVTDGPIPAAAPLVSSPAGLAIRREIEQVNLDIEEFNIGSVSGALPLPNKPFGAQDVATVLTGDRYGYGLRPFDTTRISRIGDVEAGLRIGLLRGERARALLRGAVRFPTGARDSVDHVLDLGTGDGQMDIEVGLEAAVESQRLGLAVTALYTRQLADQRTLRWTSPEQPVTQAAARVLVDRDLGDVVQLAAYPSLRLSEAFRAYGSVYYFQKTADVLAPVDPAAPVSGDPARGTAWRSLSYGGGIYYRADRGRGGTQMLPIEAGLSYQAAFSGSERTPKSTVLNLYLRLYYRVFGRAQEN